MSFSRLTRGKRCDAERSSFLDFAKFYLTKSKLNFSRGKKEKKDCLEIRAHSLHLLSDARVRYSSINRFIGSLIAFPLRVYITCIYRYTCIWNSIPSTRLHIRANRSFAIAPFSLSSPLSLRSIFSLLLSFSLHEIYSKYIRVIYRVFRLSSESNGSREILFGKREGERRINGIGLTGERGETSVAA